MADLQKVSQVLAQTEAEHDGLQKVSQVLTQIEYTAKPPFISTWTTPDTITLPLYNGGVYDFTVDWGDTTSSHITTYNQAERTHTYSSSGSYVVTIDGTIEGWYFAGSISEDKITNISQWGCLKLGNTGLYFYGCYNLTITATDILDLSDTTDLSYMFHGCSSITTIPNIDLWDISNVTDMYGMFRDVTLFNQDISSWNVSNVTHMGWMFHNAISFNQDISSWNTSACTDMSEMFRDASSFNQPLNSWNMSNVEHINSMFSGAAAFNQPLDNWDVSKVTDMRGVFENATSFNQDISSWNVSNVIEMSWMFHNATSFNQPLNNWDVSNVTGIVLALCMESMFEGATSFNQPLNNWDVSNVTGINYMFSGATSFNQPLDNWDTSKVIYMVGVFSSATSFNQPLNNWDVSNVTDMHRMFQNATSFNQPLNNWDVSNVTDMHRMFQNATSFNQDISSWLIINFNGGGVAPTLPDMRDMFTGATSFSSDNYSRLLLSWAQQVPLSEEPSITFGAPPTYYNFMALESREYLSTITGDFPIMGAGWTITGDLGYKNTQEMITYDTSDITSSSFTASGAIVSGSQYISESSNITGVSLSSSSISSGRIYDLEYYANEITVNPFIFEVQAKPNSGAPYVFTLPFIPTSSGGVYDFTVNWGDGSNIETITEIIDGVPKTHTYSTSGGYDVSILGTMEGWTTHGSIVPSGDTMYISELKQWGCFNFNNHFITEMEIGDTGTISLTGSQFVNSAIFENYGTRITATDIPNLSNIESLDVSFAGARTSIPNLCLWDLSKIKKMRFTFVMAQGIFAPINNWDISNITDMSGMFFFMSVLRPLNNWDVSNVTNMRYMFCISTLFNQDISMWDVSNVTDMSYMFNCAREFNQPLNNWDVSNVTDMSGMFGNDYFPLAGSGKFNQPLNNWITTSCTNMSQMFYNARYFDQDISMWDVSNVTDMTEMFYGATLSTTNYSNLLNGWSTQEVQPNVVFSGGNSKYNSSAADARNHLITVHGWTITDGGLE